MNEIIENFDIKNKHFESSKLLTPESTADPLTLYIEVLKVYLSFFLPSEKIDYTIRELGASTLHKRDPFLSRVKHNTSTAENLVGKSWNTFIAK